MTRHDDGMEDLFNALAALVGAIIWLLLFLGAAACHTVQQAFGRYGTAQPVLLTLALACAASVGLAALLGLALGAWGWGLFVAGTGITGLVFGTWLIDARETRAMSRDAEALDLSSLLGEGEWWRE